MNILFSAIIVGCFLGFMVHIWINLPLKLIDSFHFMHQGAEGHGEGSGNVFSWYFKMLSEHFRMPLEYKLYAELWNYLTWQKRPVFPPVARIFDILCLIERQHIFSNIFQSDRKAGEGSIFTYRSQDQLGNTSLMWKCA